MCRCSHHTSFNYLWTLITSRRNRSGTCFVVATSVVCRVLLISLCVYTEYEYSVKLIKLLKTWIDTKTFSSSVLDALQAKTKYLATGGIPPAGSGSAAVAVPKPVVPPAPAPSSMTDFTDRGVQLNSFLRSGGRSAPGAPGARAFITSTPPTAAASNATPVTAGTAPLAGSMGRGAGPLPGTVMGLPNGMNLMPGMGMPGLNGMNGMGLIPGFNPFLLPGTAAPGVFNPFMGFAAGFNPMIMGMQPGAIGPNGMPLLPGAANPMLNPALANGGVGAPLTATAASTDAAKPAGDATSTATDSKNSDSANGSGGGSSADMAGVFAELESEVKEKRPDLRPLLDTVREQIARGQPISKAIDAITAALEQNAPASSDGGASASNAAAGGTFEETFRNVQRSLAAGGSGSGGSSGADPFPGAIFSSDFLKT